MKTLFVLRHAKSSWDNPGQKDFERPLNERGRRDAPRMGRLMRERAPRPDVILCSPAERTRQTVALFATAAGLDAEPRFDERIYEASAGRLIDVVSEVERGVGSVLLVGHNPGVEELIEALTGSRERMTTAALARVALDIDAWDEVGPECGRLEWVVRPKELGDG
ncbi:MAG TPA: histidine phosphatase family protein [Pyrinomonadaceae bacterium]